MSVIVLHPLKIMRAAHSRLSSEIRFVIGSGLDGPIAVYRAITPLCFVSISQRASRLFFDC